MQRLSRYNNTTSALILIHSKLRVLNPKCLSSVAHARSRGNTHCFNSLDYFPDPSQASGFEWKEKMKGTLFSHGIMLRQEAGLARYGNGKLAEGMTPWVENFQNVSML